MLKRKIEAREVIRDIKEGFTDEELMDKYGLSAKGIQSLFGKLIAASLMTQRELDERVPLAQRTVTLTIYRCPACGYPQFSQFDECPQCGVLVSKVAKKSAAKPSPGRPVVSGTVKLTVYLPTYLCEELNSLGGVPATHIVEAIKIYVREKKKPPR